MIGLVPLAASIVALPRVTVMGLTVTFVSGPRRSGKSMVIQRMLDELYKQPPHYLRLAGIAGDKLRPPPDAKAGEKLNVRSARWINYDADLIYEVLPEALTLIHRQDRYGLVLIEADADPHLRNAYPYDRRVFIMPAPRRLTEVFRTAKEAAAALEQVLDDTAFFAREIYGMLDAGPDKTDDGSGHEARRPFTSAQMRGFLNSPLGEELATRIQFQPAYHGLVESEVILINTGVGGTSPVVDECKHRIERIVGRLRGPGGQKSKVFCCNPADPKDPLTRKLFKTLKELVQREKWGRSQ